MESRFIEMILIFRRRIATPRIRRAIIPEPGAGKHFASSIARFRVDGPSSISSTLGKGGITAMFCKEMKTIRIAILYALSIVGATAGQRDVVRADVVGLWRGLSVGHTPGEERERDLWIVERRPEGTFRTKKYRIDSYKKVFFVVTPLVEGTWTLKDSVITHRIAGTDSAVSEKVTKFDDGHLTWSHEGEGISDKDERWCYEHPLDKFRELFGPDSQFGKDYREVSKEEFENRYKPTTGE